jgi:predicted ATP-grasp superfamily ATP-dependent carboligase
MRVLLLDGHVNPAVSAVRSLSRAGHRVLVGSSGNWSKAGWSRYACGSFTYPSVEKGAKEFAAQIATIASREPGTFVLPLTEKTVMALSEYRSLIEDAGGRMVMPSHTTMLKAFDKACTTSMASSVGLASPRTCPVNNELGAQTVARGFPYPAALKARTSVEIADGRVKPTARTLYARDQREFLEAYRELHKRSAQVIAQEFILGEGVLYGALLRKGELRAEFAYQRMRSVHPGGWGAALRVSTPAETLREDSLKLIRALDPQWTGLAQVEYRVRHDGTPFFLEVNPRTWHSMPLAVYAGVDFPSMLADIAEHGDVPCHPGYPAGVVCRWWLGDLRRLLYIWKGAGNGYPGNTPGRVSALVEFVKPVRHAFHDNFIASDPLPELGDWVSTGTRALRRLAGHRVAT